MVSVFKNVNWTCTHVRRRRRETGHRLTLCPWPARPPGSRGCKCTGSGQDREEARVGIIITVVGGCFCAIPLLRKPGILTCFEKIRFQQN